MKVLFIWRRSQIDLSKLASLKEMKVAAANFDMVHRLEEILMQWYKQIEQVRKVKILYMSLKH